MNEPRPYASLSSGLLARKGAARPAMRPQAFTSLEDLGWDDMGIDAPAPGEEGHEPSSIAALTPSPRGKGNGGGHGDGAGNNDAIAQQRALADALGASEDEPAPAKKKNRRKAEVVPLPERPVAITAPAGKKAAFTLRLDAERHLRLRLACAVHGCSAQRLVTAAVDAALAADPEIEPLANRVKAGAGRI
ncbi:MAG: hypothetical protein ACT4OE_09790 [Sphingosinicella sp.]